mgnify:CR=1 FL=1
MISQPHSSDIQRTAKDLLASRSPFEKVREASDSGTAVLRAGREGKRLDPLSTGRLIADTAEGLDAAIAAGNQCGTRPHEVNAPAAPMPTGTCLSRRSS